MIVAALIAVAANGPWSFLAVIVLLTLMGSWRATSCNRPS
jgi:hypothetical protein